MRKILIGLVRIGDSLFFFVGIIIMGILAGIVLVLEWIDRKCFKGIFGNTLLRMLK